MYCLMIDSGAPPQETARWDGDPGADGECGWVGDEQVQVVGFAVELDQLDAELRADGVQGVLSQKVGMSPVNTARRNLVTNTRCA
jgi:hypothetical protein